MLKSTFSAALIVLAVVCLMRMDSPFSPETRVNAQLPSNESNAQDIEFLEQYYEERDDLDLRHNKRKRVKNERNIEKVERELQKRNHHFHEHHQAHSRDAHQVQEQNIEQQKHRIEKMHIAAKHLKDAGLGELAEQVHRQAKQQELHLREQIERIMHHEHRPPLHHETHELLHQLRNEIRELKVEVKELKEVISEKSPKYEQ